MGESDAVKPNIPQQFEGAFDYLAAWAQQGTITIVGHAGDSVGAEASGLARIRVVGNVGDYAGRRMRKFATLDVSGTAGKYLG